MKILMTGGTGFVGTILTRAFLRKGHDVTVLTRSSRTEPGPKGLSYLSADPTRKGEWQEHVPDHDAVVNLAGASIFKRWTKKHKAAIRESRIDVTENLVEAISRGKRRGIRLLSTSAVGYYGFRGDEILDESSRSGEGFLASLSREWESAALRAADHGAEVVILRFGVVLGRNGGAIEQMIRPFRWYMGAPLGSGKQWFSWIHEEDLTAAYIYILENKDLSGAVNCTAPEPVKNEEMTRVLGREMGKPVFMPAVPGFVLKSVLGEFASVILQGQRVIPKRLLQAGFQFRFPDIRSAFRDLLG
ncbi:MAG: TIGR01777 family protein [Desulfobacteraceae bacterium]|nr:MAG: TIGR01777 family protein [Desulfobacteraceae bacterium]